MGKKQPPRKLPRAAPVRLAGPGGSAGRAAEGGADEGRASESPAALKASLAKILKQLARDYGDAE
ncbi:MAG TPA: hypothetical protein VEQ85_06150, partial [Lacipirellulaceae bacterium]|nr:hypothetical protein [Lacipirellulaceae bacterium]